MGISLISIYHRHKNRLMVHMSISTMGIMLNEENHLRIFGGCACIPCNITDKREALARDNDDKMDLLCKYQVKDQIRDPTNDVPLLCQGPKMKMYRPISYRMV
jgi:hypothetical protein